MYTILDFLNLDHEAKGKELQTDRTRHQEKGHSDNRREGIEKKEDDIASMRKTMGHRMRERFMEKAWF